MRRDADERKFERARFEGPVVIDVDEDWTALGTSRDISIGGMFVEAVERAMSIPFGAHVVVYLRMSGDIVALPGVVRWTKNDGIGLQFGSIGARETHVISEAVARHAPSGTHERAARLTSPCPSPFPQASLEEEAAGAATSEEEAFAELAAARRAPSRRTRGT